MGTVLIIVACFIVAGFYAGAETGAYRLNRIRVRHATTTGSRMARLLQRVVHDMERFVCMTLAGDNVALYGATVFSGVLIKQVIHGKLAGELANTLILSPFLLVFAEMIPKATFQMLANRLMIWASPLLWLTNVILWPVTTVLLGVVGFWRKIVGGRTAPRQMVVTSQYLRFFLSEGKQEGVITPQQDLMVRNIIQFGERPVRQAVIPVSRVRMISSDASGEEARRIIAEHGHARLVVYEGRRENVVGVLLALDYLSAGGHGPIRDFVRTPALVGVGERLDDAFRRMQGAGQTLGIVVDSQKRAVGIVTMGDLLQEIFAALGTQ